MPSPFPGMNPYLENPEFWPEVHHLLIGILAETLNPQLLPKYRVAIEKRVYQMNGDDALFVGIPDVTVERSRTATKESESNVVVASASGGYRADYRFALRKKSRKSNWEPGRVSTPSAFPFQLAPHKM